ncbi:hypothetical protein KC850_02835 [Candidatus Kaiserbacteria bacterium]|nr:hypothetical protein [Candidatus Kaiserbacteria bacterium]
MLSYIGFISAFAVGMAIDLFFATLARFNEDHLNNKNWSVWLALSHSVLPGIIFTALWNFGLIIPDYVMGIIGSTFIGLLVYELFMEEIGREPTISLINTLTKALKAFRIKRESVKHILFIMSVSWDIVIGVIGTVPIIESGNWSMNQIVFMFVCSGLCAGGAAMIALRICSHWRDSELQNYKTLARRKVTGAFWSLVAISTFGLTSFVYIFSIKADFILMFPISVALIGLLFIIYRTELRSEANAYAIEVEKEQG